MRITTLQKAFILTAGPDLTWKPVKDDDNPPRYYEPLPSVPFKGKTTDKERVNLRIKVYSDTSIDARSTVNRLFQINFH